MKLTVILTTMLTTLAAFGFVLVCLPALQAQSNLNSNNLNTKMSHIPPVLRKYYTSNYWSEQKRESDIICDEAWIHQSWTGNNAPYATARAQVERDNETYSPQALVAKYEVPAKLRPNDPLTQFSWAYAVHLAIKSTDFPAQETQDTLYSAELALAKLPSPHTYDYVRLRFLIVLQGPGGGAYHELIGTAYRMLQKDPNDFPVISGLIALDSMNLDKAAQKEGYSLIQKMIKKYPEKPQVYDLLGGWYYDQYLQYRDPADYHLAMANYQRAHDAYPVTATRRAGLTQVMSFLTMRYHQISGS